MNWQPIETAPQSQLVLVWMEGFHDHSDLHWHRSGFAFGVFHDGQMSGESLRRAAERIIGPNLDECIWHLYPTHWCALEAPST